MGSFFFLLFFLFLLHGILLLDRDLSLLLLRAKAIAIRRINSAPEISPRSRPSCGHHGVLHQLEGYLRVPPRPLLRPDVNETVRPHSSKLRHTLLLVQLEVLRAGLLGGGFSRNFTVYFTSLGLSGVGSRPGPFAASAVRGASAVAARARGGVEHSPIRRLPRVRPRAWHPP